MTAQSQFYTTLLVPAVIGIGSYLLISFVLWPLWTRYHNRYSRYLPLDSISAASTSVRDRIADFIIAYMLPRGMRERMGADIAYDEAERRGMDPVIRDDGIRVRGRDLSDDEEELQNFEGRNTAGRDGISLDPRRHNDASDRRLSRDLEAGFASDSESEDGRNGRR